MFCHDSLIIILNDIYILSGFHSNNTFQYRLSFRKFVNEIQFFSHIVFIAVKIGCKTQKPTFEESQKIYYLVNKKT